MSEILWPPLVASIFLIMHSIWLSRSPRLQAISSLAVPFSVFLSLFYYISDYFTGTGITSAVVFHIFYGIDHSATLQVTSFPELLWLVSGVTLALLFWIVLAIRKNRSLRYSSRSHLSRPLEAAAVLSLILVGLFFHPAVVESHQLWKQLRPGDGAALSRDLIVPNATPTSAPKSLLYIYAESFERTFLDVEAFPHLAPEMNLLASEGISFHGLKQAPLTDWTTAGMVASQCGMPLAPISDNRHKPQSEHNTFLPGAVCLGDILKTNGYKLSYIGGADLDFAGKRSFYATHQFDRLFGFEEIRQLKDDVPSMRWGVYDDTVFEIALDELRALSSSDSPFALIVTTTATHPPQGFPSPSCESLSDRQQGILGAVSCSSKQILDFVREVEALGIEDLVIGIGSDHLLRASDASDMLQAKQLRRENLFVLKSPSFAPRVIKRKATTMDIAPTVLRALGWEIEGLGLGRDLLGRQPTLSEAYGDDHYFSMIQSWRMGLWESWEE